jgi:exodeoxyribonuclease-3
VNGIRAASAKPDWAWFAAGPGDIVALQEVKADVHQAPDNARTLEGRHVYWNASRGRKGYSGVAVFSRARPLAASLDLLHGGYGGEPFNHEGRVVHLEYPTFHFLNVYFPHGGEENRRVPYKMAFFEEFLAQAEALRAVKSVVVCGDFNIAHKAIDLARPKANEGNTGFLPEERAWMDRFVAAGYVDTFRHVRGDLPDQYTWWSYKTRARESNVGWRLDYFFVSEELAPAVRDAWIEHGVYGSDHCPVGLDLDVPA